MTIYRYDMTIPVRVVSALHSGGVDEVPVRPMTDEDDRTVQPNAFVRNGLARRSCRVAPSREPFVPRSKNT